MFNNSYARYMHSDNTDLPYWSMNNALAYSVSNRKVVMSERLVWSGSSRKYVSQSKSFITYYNVHGPCMIHACTKVRTDIARSNYVRYVTCWVNLILSL